MRTPKFSVIVPVYNTGKELKRCVDSILEQEYTGFELILVDDGSTDESGQICDHYSEKDNRVKVIHQNNSGCSEARNTGVRNASGDYLMFVDSDDMWDDVKALQDIARIIERNKDLETIVFGVKIYSDDGKLIKERRVSPPKGTTKEDILTDLIYSNEYFSASYVKVLKRDFFLNNNLLFIKGLLSGEDVEWSARIMVLSRSIAVYPSTFYKRIRRSEGSITSSIGKKNVTDILFSIETGIQFILDHSESESLTEIYYEYWAYNYAMLLGLAYRLRRDPDFPLIYDRLKNLKWLLKYDHVKKVKMMKIAERIIGLKNTMHLLSVYYG